MNIQKTLSTPLIIWSFFYFGTIFFAKMCKKCIDKEIFIWYNIVRHEEIFL